MGHFLFSILNCFFLFHILFFILADAGSIGVNYGRVANNLPSAVKVVQLLKSQGLDRVKVYDTDPAVLRALAGTGIKVTVDLPNEQLFAAAKSLSFAHTWVQRNVAGYHPATQIEAIAVGNEVFVDPHNTTRFLVPAMRNIHQALIKYNLDSAIKVSSPIALSALQNSYPSSAGSFRPELMEPVFKPMFEFLRETGSFLMVNAYPFFAYESNTDVISLDYALFMENPGVVDTNNGLRYFSLFDAQIDAVFAAMSALKFDDIKLVVTETGWPSKGDENENGASVENAAAYNGNLVRRILTGGGTPLRPKADLTVYLFALFNENKKTGPTSERNYGLFYPDEKKVYDIPFTVEGLKNYSGSRSPAIGDRHVAAPVSGGVSKSRTALQSNNAYTTASEKEFYSQYNFQEMTPVCPFFKSDRPGPDIGRSKCPFGYDSQTNFKLGPLSCVICQALLFQPSRCVPCSHVFCRACISRLKDCPVCGADIESTESDANLQALVDRFIDGHARIKRSQIDTEAEGDCQKVIYEDVSLERGAFLVQQAMRALRACNVESAKSRLEMCAQDIRDELTRRGNTSELCSQLGAVLGMLGDCCRAVGDGSAAVNYFEESVKFLMELAKDDLEITHTLSVSLNKIGDLKYYDGDLPAARSYYFRSLGIRRDAAKHHPNATSLILDIATSLAKVADADRSTGKEDLAIQGFQEAINLLESETLASKEAGIEQRRVSVLEFVKNQLIAKNLDAVPGTDAS